MCESHVAEVLKEGNDGSEDVVRNNLLSLTFSETILRISNFFLPITPQLS